MYSQQVPQTEMQRASELTDQPNADSQGDLLVNNLIYKQPKALSLAKTRTMVKQFFQRSDYPSAPNKTAIIDWNTGASYIDVGNSYLSFNVTAYSADNNLWDFGSGSAMNCISRITIRSRSGTELERLEGANLWSKFDMDYSVPRNYKSTIGSAMGVGETTENRYPYLCTVPGGDRISTKLLIPLKQLCPFFRPLKGQLLPPQLASGLHIEIVFENTSTAFVKPVSVGAPVTDYDIEDITFMLDTVDLSDETQKTINMESADNGLEWVTPRIYTAITSLPVGQSQVSVQVRKSCSQATMAYSVLQTTASTTDVEVDSLNSIIVPPCNWQYRIGSLFFPQQPIVENSGSGIVNQYVTAQSYYEALYAFDKPKHPFHECSVSIRDFQSGGKGMFAMTASKDDSLFLSGLPINNSRVLEFNLDYTDSVPSDKKLTSFLEYIQVVKVFIDNVAVSI